MKTLDDGTQVQAVEETITPDQLKVGQIVNKYAQIGEIIGKGISSYVVKAFYIPYNYPIAIKVINVFDRDKRHQLINDLKTFLTEYDCKNLIQFIGAYYDDGNIKIMLEFMDQGSLRNVIKQIYNPKRKLFSLISEQFIATIAYEVTIPKY